MAMVDNRHLNHIRPIDAKNRVRRNKQQRKVYDYADIVLAGHTRTYSQLVSLITLQHHHDQGVEANESVVGFLLQLWL